jgi:hypothetical protein
MTFKYSVIFVLSMVLLFVLNIPLFAQIDKAKPAPKPAGKVTSDNPYGLDYKSQNWQRMGANRLSKDILLVKYNEMRKKPRGTMDYKKVVEFIGVEPTRYKFNGSNRVFEWQATESTREDFEVKCLYVLFFDKNGEWLNAVPSKKNI